MFTNFDYISNLVYDTAVQFSSLKLTYLQLVIALSEGNHRIVDGNQCDFLVPDNVPDANGYMESLTLAADKLAKRLVNRGLLYAEEDLEHGYIFVPIKRTIKLLLICNKL